MQTYERLVQEDLNTGEDRVWITAPGGGELCSTQVGPHTFARGQKQYSATWSPGAIAAGSSATTTVTVPDAEAGDHVLASFDKMLTNALRISAHISADDTAKVVLHNPTAASITPESGTVRVLVFPFPVVATTGTVSVYVQAFAGGPYTGADVTIGLYDYTGGERGALLDSKVAGADGYATFTDVAPGDVQADDVSGAITTTADDGTVTAGQTLSLTVVEEQT